MRFQKKFFLLLVSSSGIGWFSACAKTVLPGVCSNGGQFLLNGCNSDSDCQPLSTENVTCLMVSLEDNHLTSSISLFFSRSLYYSLSLPPPFSLSISFLWVFFLALILYLSLSLSISLYLFPFSLSLFLSFFRFLSNT